MRNSVPVLCAVLLVAGCRRAAVPPVPASLTAQVSGTIAVSGLSAPVRVTRDRWGVPHIYAEHQADLFYAQGFVQAQDRLFQMDLWRRASQGRLAEILGANFIARDAMTRRVQYDGDLDAEWASYGPDTKAIVSAFVQGINAWVTLARERLPEEFVRAGWQPEFWSPEDLLSRTDAFIASGDALGDVFRARLRPRAQPSGLDLGVVAESVGDAIRLVGTRPFFIGSNAWAIRAERSADGAPMLANDPHRELTAPSPFYLVHLHAPGWNVVGATPPWLPGVMLGHNDRIAWGMTAYAADVQDVYVERVNPDNPHQVDDRGRWVNTRVAVGKLFVKGRRAPVDALRESTVHGATLAVDREKHYAFALRWSGTEPGAAAGLGALALDRARSWTEFRVALGAWKMPAEEVVYADADGNIGSQVAALVPVRAGWNGDTPVPGWTGRDEWTGWRSLDDLPHAFNPAAGHIVSANGDGPRLTRLADVFASTRTFDLHAFTALQRDVVSTTAARLVPLLATLRSDREDVERARLQLRGWDRRMSADSEAAAIYAGLERHALRTLAADRVGAALADECVSRSGAELVDALVKPSQRSSRDRVLLSALAAAVDEVTKAGGGTTWGERHQTMFRHVLGVGDTASRFNVGPFATPGYADTVMSTGSAGAAGRGLDVTRGPSFSAVYHARDWDRSIVQNAPGQSGSPASPHFSNLAKPWAAGEYFPLSFSDQAVLANAEATLTLVPTKAY